MALKSYRFSKRKKGKKRKRTAVGDIVIGGTTAIIGVGLLSETARAVNRI